MRNAWKLPAGVACPRRPVETGQVQRVAPSTETVMRWVDLSMLMTTFAWAAVTANNAETASATMASVRMTRAPWLPVEATLTVVSSHGNARAWAW